jgi:hypothetical protein
MHVGTRDKSKNTNDYKENISIRWFNLNIHIFIYQTGGMRHVRLKRGRVGASRDEVDMMRGVLRGETGPDGMSRVRCVAGQGERAKAAWDGFLLKIRCQFFCHT